MEKVSTKKSTFKRITSILLYVLAAILFIFAVIGLVLKFTGNKVELFGKRIDVVLTDSMSVKNPEYEEFLKGHDDQIQALDVVVSNTKVNDDDLNVYDIVLFQNHDLGVTDMHRIVDKTERNNDHVDVTHSYFQTINGIEGLSFKKLQGGIASNVICATQITLVTYSLQESSDSHFVFAHQTGLYESEITREYKDGGYYTTYNVYTRTTSPRTIVISHSMEYDYSSEIISNCSIYSTEGLIELTKNNLSQKDDGYEGSFNLSYYYEIRGDKANTSDGKKFTIDDIYGKVTTTIPKLGFVVRYLSSIWGMVLLFGLATIFIVYDIIALRIDKKERLQSQEKAEESEGQKDE